MHKSMRAGLTTTGLELGVLIIGSSVRSRGAVSSSENTHTENLMKMRSIPFTNSHRMNKLGWIH